MDMSRAVSGVGGREGLVSMISLAVIGRELESEMHDWMIMFSFTSSNVDGIPTCYNSSADSTKQPTECLSRRS